MNFRQLIALYGLTLLAVFGLACLWEFVLETALMGDAAVLPGHEDFPARWEHVLTATGFAAIAMIVPAWLVALVLKKQTAAENAFRRSEGVLRAFIDHAPALVALKHADGRYLLMNQQYSDQLGLDPRQTEGKDAHSVFPSHLAEAFAEQEHQALESGQEVTEERVIPHKDGDHVHLCTKFPVTDGDGSIVGIGTFSMDITDQKATEDRINAALIDAEQANRAKTHFLANMSHELRTPLNSIIGFSQVIGSDLPLDPMKRKEYAGDIQHSAEHLLSLINDLLDFSKIEAGQLVLHETEVDLEELVEQSCRMIKPDADEKDVTVTHAVGKGLPLLRADSRCVTQVLLNLVANAVKFNVTGGKVNVMAAPATDGQISVSIADTGIGIAPEDMNVVLEPFGQAGVSANHSHAGTGLGLSVSKQLMELHGGTLSLDSTPGKGTTVTVCFPAERIVGT
ncbi:MAG: PAS domain-containing sensor histidine kinase [Rhodospirillales bacterium]